MNYDRQYLKSVGITTGIFALPAITSGFSWLYLLAPFPLIFFPIYLGFNKGFKIVGHSILISGVLALIFGSLATLIFSLSMLPVGFVLARSINRKETLERSALQGAILMIAIWLFSGLLASVISQQNIYAEVLKSIDNSLEAAYTAYSQSPEISADIQYELQSLFTRIRSLIPQIFPGILIVSVISTIFINMTLSNALLIRNNCPSWPHFTNWKLPDQLIWVTILGGVLQFIAVTGLKALGLNLLLVFGALYFIQGLAVMTTFFGKWSVPKLVRILIIFFLVIQAYGFLLVALLGVADTWGDFRKPKEPPKPEE